MGGLNFYVEPMQVEEGLGALEGDSFPVPPDQEEELLTEAPVSRGELIPTMGALKFSSAGLAQLKSTPTCRGGASVVATTMTVSSLTTLVTSVFTSGEPSTSGVETPPGFEPRSPDAVVPPVTSEASGSWGAPQKPQDSIQELRALMVTISHQMNQGFNNLRA